MSDEPVRIVVELVSSEAVKRLEDRDEALRLQIMSLEDKLSGLHRTVYELMERLSNFKR